MKKTVVRIFAGFLALLFVLGVVYGAIIQIV